MITKIKERREKRKRNEGGIENSWSIHNRLCCGSINSISGNNHRELQFSMGKGEREMMVMPRLSFHRWTRNEIQFQYSSYWFLKIYSLNSFLSVFCWLSDCPSIFPSVVFILFHFSGVEKTHAVDVDIRLSRSMTELQRATMDHLPSTGNRWNITYNCLFYWRLLLLDRKRERKKERERRGK